VLEIFHTLRTLNLQGLTIFLVEQNARQALSIAQRAYVMENGGITLSGASAALLKDKKIVDAYLGDE
jgi:branched-chain amino acid transport system ATP-binding protein